MKLATARPATVPALVLCAVLMTSAEAARAGGETVVPFPGPSVSGPSVSGTSVSGDMEDGGGETAEAAPLPLGAAAAGAEAGPTLPGAAEDEIEAPPDAGSEVPAVDAGRPDAAVPDDTMASEKADVPAGGSRLLRALAERQKALVPETFGPARSDGPGDAARPGTLRDFTAGGCPRALLRRLLAGAAGEADALSALGIEREILALCRERQEILAGLFEAETRLSELREAGRAPEPQPQIPMPRAAAAPALETPAVETAARSPLRAAPGGAAEKANETDPGAGDTRAADTPAAEPRAPRYAWFSIIGTAGALRAGVTDGTGVWFVREGDPLPGGATIAAIAGRPPGVRVTGAGESGEAALLPFRARPGGGP